METTKRNVTDTFAKRLKQLREEQGFSQAQLGEKIGISRGSVSYYENKSRIPDIEILEKLATFFNVSSDWLLGLTNIRTTDTTIQDINSILGLSEAAINTLLKIKEEEFLYPIFISEILECEDLLILLGQYFIANPVSGCLIIDNVGNVKLKKYNEKLGRYDVEKISIPEMYEQLMISKIIKTLKKIRYGEYKKDGNNGQHHEKDNENR